MYHLEGLKYTCMGALERGLCKDNVSHILEEIEDLICLCDELKRIFQQYSELHNNAERKKRLRFRLLSNKIGHS
jgi:hypothetical protein